MVLPLDLENIILDYLKQLDNKDRFDKVMEELLNKMFWKWIWYNIDIILITIFIFLYHIGLGLIIYLCWKD